MSKKHELLDEVQNEFVTAFAEAARHPEQAEEYGLIAFNSIKRLVELRQSGVYSNKELRNAIDEEHIICYPFRPESVNGSSIDVTLGEYFFTTDRTGNDVDYVPFDLEHVARYFDGEVKKAIPHREFADRYRRGALWPNIPEDHPIIALRPGERILAHTHEFIGIKGPGTTSMQSRSTWGRNGISTCLDAGWGDPGYINRWTMEIYNWNKETTPLPVGERIAQIVFMHTGVVEGDYGDEGKYQTSTDLNEIIKNWKPTDMLPRAFKDTRVKPLPILDLETGEQIRYESNQNIQELLTK